IVFSFNNSLTSVDATITTDREKVYAVLTNLVKNAIKYSEKGSIEIGYNKVGRGESQHLEFFVKDTGIGIPKKRQKAIFERFIQADLSDKNAYQGAGLGLAISKAYVEMLDGKIWVVSEENNGSTFYFTLPYQSKKINLSSAKSEKTNTFDTSLVNKLKILIVEDDEPSEELISITVKKIGENIVSVKSGEEAIKACHNNPDIDLILMDIRMPKMDGHEATRLIRKFNKDVIIIAQTAYALSGDKEKAIAAGCNDYISKPVNVNQLMQKIKNQLNK
ncbi:MAG: ATP-binding protein, partial [Bacteroidota bacterium]